VQLFVTEIMENRIYNGALRPIPAIYSSNLDTQYQIYAKYV